MVKRVFGIYRVEYDGNEIGYMRIEITPGPFAYLNMTLRTPFITGYSSYVYAVLGCMDYYCSVPDDFNVALIDTYEEYTE